ncbi:hypothetical protein [Candidatus Villigracilis affinis]|uniref:hypothetical protein n=1 Tax=Candidatus Villigracilis affinis TaxID=3140682 RepID=UPI001DE50DBC|nr:hypothetical protein [Anaerolineales bacterium]
MPLPEGTGTANYTVTSTSGRTASGLSTWQRDGTPPDLEVILPPVDGRNGWYVSEVDLSATATDAISGLASLWQAPMVEQVGSLHPSTSQMGHMLP